MLSKCGRKCDFCGAPRNPKRTECRYCETAYMRAESCRYNDIGWIVSYNQANMPIFCSGSYLERR